jgi:hypothetical protein
MLCIFPHFVMILVVVFSLKEGKESDMARDDFKVSVKNTLAKRSAYVCSNPGCRKTTIGASKDPDKSSNIGVASHICAASPGGPRFDSKMTTEERAGINNGIWLCQNCSKLIDVDVSSFSVETLRFWKHTREDETMFGLASPLSTEYYPQPQNATYTPIPKINGAIYETARNTLVDSGWLPMMNNWSYPDEESTLKHGNGEHFWSKGFYEIMSACPTGYAFCRFKFKDVMNNELCVITAGECYPEDEIYARVTSFYIQDK